MASFAAGFACLPTARLPLSARLRQPPPVPTTSIYSRSDGVVAWQTCSHGRRHKQVQDIEVDGSHIGMGCNAKVLDTDGDRLGQAPGKWQAYAKASSRPTLIAWRRPRPKG